ncbi:hypothetical protein H845_3435 (plasmid) [Komagataeibacter xylinus E25]|nr:hypothetical protein H845_3435 [Komagataeibacter xylinus E25]
MQARSASLFRLFLFYEYTCRYYHAPATTSIINLSSSTSDRHEMLAYQTVARVPLLERGAGNRARPHHAMANRAAPTGFSDPFKT